MGTVKPTASSSRDFSPTLMAYMSVVFFVGRASKLVCSASDSVVVEARFI